MKIEKLLVEDTSTLKRFIREVSEEDDKIKRLMKYMVSIVDDLDTIIGIHVTVLNEDDFRLEDSHNYPDEETTSKAYSQVSSLNKSADGKDIIFSLDDINDGDIFGDVSKISTPTYDFELRSINIERFGVSFFTRVDK